MDNWKAEVEEMLKNREKDRQAVDGLRAQILQKEADMIHLTELGYGQPDAEEGVPPLRIRKLMDEKRVLEAKVAAKAAHVAQVDRVMASLNGDHQEVLTVFYCSGLRPTAAVHRLEWRLNVGRSEVYRIKDRAILEFAYRMGRI